MRRRTPKVAKIVAKYSKFPSRLDPFPMPNKKQAVGSSHIVSSSHLVSEKNAEISEFEFGLIIANNAFTRWIIHCAAAAGAKELSAALCQPS